VRELTTLRGKFRSLHRSTLHRWRTDPKLNLPKPAKIINGVPYYYDDELEAWTPPAGGPQPPPTPPPPKRKRTKRTPAGFNEADIIA